MLEPSLRQAVARPDPRAGAAHSQDRPAGKGRTSAKLAASSTGSTGSFLRPARRLQPSPSTMPSCSGCWNGGARPLNGTSGWWSANPAGKHAKEAAYAALLRLEKRPGGEKTTRATTPASRLRRRCPRPSAGWWGMESLPAGPRLGRASESCYRRARMHYDRHLFDAAIPTFEVIVRAPPRCTTAIYSAICCSTR